MKKVPPWLLLAGLGLGAWLVVRYYPVSVAVLVAVVGVYIYRKRR